MRVEDQVPESQENIQFCTFRLRDQLFGVDILEVKEIDRIIPFTPVHHAPPEVRGLVNIRGQIFLILDLGALLDERLEQLAPESRLLIFKDGMGESFGILVDRIGDVTEVSAKSITRYTEGAVGDRGTPGRMGFFKTGVCQLKDELMVVLNGSKILEYVRAKMGGGQRESSVSRT
jgi:chemotaxis signal transduction protein